MAAITTPEQEQIVAFLRRIEALVARGFKGSLTLQCPGDRTVRSLEVREYFDLQRLEDEQNAG